MYLKQFAEELKKEMVSIAYRNNPQLVNRIVRRINLYRKPNGRLLSLDEKKKVIRYLSEHSYSADGRLCLTEADNSAFLSMVQAISQAVKGGK